MPFPSFTGDQRISHEVSIIGGTIFGDGGVDEKNTLSVSGMNAELEGAGIIFEMTPRTQDPVFEDFLNQNQ